MLTNVRRTKKKEKPYTEVVTDQRNELEKDPIVRELIDLTNYQKPKQRTECLKMKRPCLFVSCKYHLYLDVNPDTKSIKFNFPGKEVWELRETCSLDVADKGGVTLEEVGAIMNLTRERIRQVEMRALQKLKTNGAKYNIKNLFFANK
ncbi:MAG TPA: sigma factor-like helix-turn-helix DNA-binding protein [bacterium]|nr:sigma factor-like helix-turn-helix DNA-binding protein [bacterium]HSA33553.1 sigma factor-like helix-turn-helix DNA-binding protein [bacterium]